MSKKRPARRKDLQEVAPERSQRYPVTQLALCALLFCSTLIAYWPALQGSLLWDDESHVTRPELESLHGLWRIWFDLGATQQYYPLLHSAFWLEHRIWGDTVLGYHFTNLLLHTAAACLVVLIAKRLSLAGAWAAGFVFALHPVCVEAVAWISEQKSTLSGVFYLTSALLYLHFYDTRRKSQYVLATGLFVLALLTKTVSATLPAALLVIVWWRRGRLSWRSDVLPLLPWIALGVPAGLFTAWVERTYIGATGVAFALTLPQRCLLAGRAIWFYAGKLVWPANLAFSYPRWHLDAGVWWQWIFPAATLAVAIGLCAVARRNRGPLAAFLLFVGTLFPVLGFLNVLPFRYSFVADHFQYLASLALIVPITAALAGEARRLALSNAWRMALAAVFLLPLFGLTWVQSGTYADLETLYRTTLARNPASWLAHNNLGLLLVQQPGRMPDAIAEYRAALEIEPNYPEAHFNLGSALVHSGMPEKLPDAIAEYREALRLKPDYVEAHYNLANVLSQLPGRLPDAIAQYRDALRMEPDLAEAHANLGNALAQIPGRLPDAIAEYQAALQIKPGLVRQRVNLANALSQIPGRLPDAITEYQEALRIDPSFAEAHFYLANALSHTPARLPDAIAECEAALRISPDFDAAQKLLEELKGRAAPQH
jgi:tetratricopeptide (TPR) repeat protein